MFICDECGALFEDPVLEEYDEPMPDGFKEHWTVLHCPECGSAFVSGIVEDER